MNYKIVTDSSSNLSSLKDVNFSVVPLKIITTNNEYTDSEKLNIEAMLEEIKASKDSNAKLATTKEAWLDAFGDADFIFGVTFTSHLSNSFEVAREAKAIYEKQNPLKKVFILDSLSAGPEIQLIISKIEELIKLKKSYTEIRNSIMDYRQRTRLMFTLPTIETITNYSRINPAIAKHASSLGYRILGKASFEGNFISTRICHGQKNTFKKLIEEIKSSGYRGGRLVISHTDNEKSALNLKALLTEAFGNVQIDIMKNGGLCSYYTKMGGIFVGYEI